MDSCQVAITLNMISEKHLHYKQHNIIIKISKRNNGLKWKVIQVEAGRIIIIMFILCLNCYSPFLRGQSIFSMNRRKNDNEAMCVDVQLFTRIKTGFYYYWQQ